LQSHSAGPEVPFALVAVRRLLAGTDSLRLLPDSFVSLATTGGRMLVAQAPGPRHVHLTRPARLAAVARAAGPSAQRRIASPGVARAGRRTHRRARDRDIRGARVRPIACRSRNITANNLLDRGFVDEVRAMIAEGVETAEVARELLSYGCELAQGYCFGHPPSAADIEAQWLEPAAIGSRRRAARRPEGA
jgi:hypothetical protein